MKRLCKWFRSDGTTYWKLSKWIKSTNCAHWKYVGWLRSNVVWCASEFFSKFQYSKIEIRFSNWNLFYSSSPPHTFKFTLYNLSLLIIRTFRPTLLHTFHRNSKLIAPENYNKLLAWYNSVSKRSKRLITLPSFRWIAFPISSVLYSVYMIDVHLRRAQRQATNSA